MEMVNYENFRKIVSIVIIIAFVFHFQSNILLHPQDQSADEISEQFTRAKEDFKVNLESSRMRFKRLIKNLNKESFLYYSNRKKILGQCYLLLGAIDEREGKVDAAKENYQKAIVEYDTETVGGIDLSNLPIYKRTLIEERFKKAKRNYIEGKETGDKDKFETAKTILEGLEKELTAAKKEDKELLGKVYILLGAANEKLFGEKPTRKQRKLLKYYYRKKARKLFPPKFTKTLTKDKESMKEKELIKDKNKGVIPKEKKKIGKESCKPIEGINLCDLKYFKKYYCKEKKKIPVWLVIAGVVVVGVVLAIILSKKKEEENEYTLMVILEDGVEGNPGNGTHKYKEGEIVPYSYQPMDGYSNLEVLIDGNPADPSGTVVMDQNHTVRATVDANEVHFVTDKDAVEVPQGGTADFNVKLSAQPKTDVNVTVLKEGGDEDISVLEGGNLTFTLSDWDTFQKVTLHADADDDTENGQATILIRASGEAGIPEKTITATEQDDDVTVSIVKPKNGTKVTRGTSLNIEARASSGNRIERVKFFVDNKLIGTDSASPYEAVWDTSQYLEGIHNLWARAYDNRGNKKESHVVKVEIITALRR